MGSLMHIGKMFPALDWDRNPGEGERYFEVTSLPGHVLVRLGKKINEEEPEQTIGVNLSEQDAREVFEAFKDAMHRAGYKV